MNKKRIKRGKNENVKKKKKMNKRHTNKLTVRQVIQTDGAGDGVELR